MINLPIYMDKTVTKLHHLFKGLHILRYRDNPWYIRIMELDPCNFKPYFDWSFMIDACTAAIIKDQSQFLSIMEHFSIVGSESHLTDY